MGWGGGSLLPDNVEFLANFQVASGLKGENWLYIKKKNNGVRKEERLIGERGIREQGEKREREVRGGKEGNR